LGSKPAVFSFELKSPAYRVYLFMKSVRILDGTL
jgi:hypothetical protein